jgi:NADPH:quinone reductase-like Zn-dependent oxidoreductase
MRAIVMHQTGSPDVLGLEDVPMPSPGPGEVLVRTEASGVNFAETRSRAGAFLPLMPAALPARVGVEAAGVVDAIGKGVDPALAGTRVLATNGNGTHAEYFTVAVPAITPVPDEVSATDAVAVGVQGATALALLDAARLTGAENVLIEAAGGGVGGYLVQLAKAAGAARVVATAGSAAKQDHALAHGADAVVDHRDHDWTDHVRDASGGTFEVIFESIGGSSARRLLDAMTTGIGRMVFYGQLAGPAEITPLDLMLRTLTLIGCGSSPADYRSGDRPATGWLARLDHARAAVLDRLAAGQIRPVIDCTLPLSEAQQAHQRIENREAIGKIILIP